MTGAKGLRGDSLAEVATGFRRQGQLPLEVER
jgi:hypothetical protein